MTFSHWALKCHVSLFSVSRKFFEYLFTTPACGKQKQIFDIQSSKFDTFKSMSCRGYCYWAWNSKTVKLLCHPPPLCSMKRSTAIYSFFSNSVPAVMDVYFIPSSKKMTFQRPSQSLELIIQEWWAFQNDTIWHHDSPCTFWTFQRISFEVIHNKSNLPSKKF